MTTTLDTTYQPRSTSPSAIGAVSAAVALTGTFVGANDWSEIGIIAPLVVVVTAAVFGLVVPRALRKESAGGTALALAIPAILLLVPAFWAGIPFVLGAAAAVVGNAGRRAPSGSGRCIAGLVLGVLAMLGYVGIYVSDVLAGGAGFLFG